MALLLIALQHCPHSSAEEARSARWHQSLLAADQSVPFGDAGHGCENESGCLCRGALAVQLVDLQETPSACWLQPMICNPLVASLNDGRSNSMDGPETPVPDAIPLFGKQLRARIVSFLN